MRRAYLVMGKPRIGKTTVIKSIVHEVGRERCGGFYTEEIHGEEDTPDKRMGFRLVTLDGQEGILAHVAFENLLHLGRYGINLDCLEAAGLAAIERARASKQLIVIDELGPIQAYSEPFKKTIVHLFHDAYPLLGTIALEAHPWLDVIKQQKNIELYELTRSNQRDIMNKVIKALR